MSALAPVRGLSRLWVAPGPSVGLDIASGRVTALAVGRRGGKPVILDHAIEPLPSGALAPGLNASNIVDRAAVGAAVRRVLDRMGRPRRIALVLSDSVAKVSLVRFEEVPTRAEDLDQLVRLQVRRSAPFRIEDAVVSYTRGVVLSDAGQEFVVAVARRDIVQEYEAVCDEAGAHAGVIDLATFSLINLVLRSGSGGDGAAGDWLIVHVAPDHTTMAIVRDETLVFFRHRRSDDGGDLTDMVHQTAMYYEDRLGGARFRRVLLAGDAVSRGDDAGTVRRSLENRLGSTVEPIDLRTAAYLSSRSAAAPDRLDALASPLGLLLRSAA